MLKELSKSELIISLIARKEEFNKCRIIYGKVSPSNIVEDDHINTYISNIVNPVLTTETTLSSTEEASTTISYSTEAQEPVLVNAVTKNEDSSKGEASKTYTEQFKRGYFGKRKRF